MSKTVKTPAIDIDTDKPLNYKKLAMNVASAVASTAVVIAAAVVVKNAIDNK